MIEVARQWTKQLKQETYTVYLAYKDPRVPWYARLFGACVVGYVFSPVDLIPDFIPVLGYLDDLVLVPLGITLALRMVPGPVLAECREKARAAATEGKPTSRVAGGVVVAVWMLLAVLAVVLALRILGG